MATLHVSEALDEGRKGKTSGVWLYLQQCVTGKHGNKNKKCIEKYQFLVSGGRPLNTEVMVRNVHPEYYFKSEGGGQERASSTPETQLPNILR